MKFLNYSFVVVVLASTLFGASQIVRAQTDASSYNPVTAGDIQEQISGDMSPTNPAPGDTVTMTLTAYGTDLNNATISWSVNGTQVQKDTGLTQFSVQAGNNGETKKVTAVINTSSGVTVTKSFVVSAQDVSIVYEADSYVPPFYKGKGLYNKEGTVTLVAMPNLVSSSGAKLNPKSLIYKWTIDGTVQGSKSGYGKNTYVYTGSILAKDVLFQVDVSSIDGTVTGRGTMLLSVEDPQVLLYEKNPLYGIMFNKELSSNGFNLNDTETSIFAVPYSMSADTAQDSSLTYVWTLNGSTIPVPQSQNYATFRNSSGQKGSSAISVLVSSATHLLQQAGNSLSINF
jgi:hypothetical protein